MLPSIRAFSCVAALAVTVSVHAETKPKFASGVLHEGTKNVAVELKGAKEIYLVATDGGDGFVADWAEWIEPVFVKADGTRIKLTELKSKSAQVGWGELGVNTRSDGQKPMKVNGETVAFGLAAHAPSQVVFDVPEGAVRFEARVGIDEGGTSQNGGSTVEFMVFTEKPALVIAERPAHETTLAINPNTKRGSGPEAAQTSLQFFKVPEGLEVTVFASEPMLKNPTNLDIDERGRVWATEVVNYRGYAGKLRPEGDRVVILEDTDGDGLADKETTFYQDPKLTNPLGICVLPTVSGKGTQVIVSAAPNVWLLTDTDGDGKADKAEILLKVGGSWNHDHQIHAFSFGPDGKLYFNFGNEGQKLMWPDGTTVVDMAGNKIENNGKPYRQGMVFRCDLTDGKLTNIETLGWNFRNNYEVCVDSFGTMWQSDNDDDGNKGVRIAYVMDYGNFGYTDEITGAGWQAKRTNWETDIPHRHWHQNDPGVVPNLLFTGQGSPTGICVYEGKLLPQPFQNQLIHCEAGSNVVRAYPATPDGAGYKAEIVNILKSSDSWFRPSDVGVAPDGSLLVADWNDPGVGGHAMGDNQFETMRGRIYRVAPIGNKLSVPKLDLASAAGCVAALQSPNLCTRYLAWTKLHEMQAAAEKDLQDLWASPDPRLRSRALNLLARITGRSSEYMNKAMTDKDENIRITGLRIVRELKPNSSDVIALVKKLVKDPSPAVRRECALALRGNPSPDAPALWATLALQHDGKDRWYLEALGIGEAGQDEKFLSAWLAAVGTKCYSAAGRDILWRSRAPKAAAYLAKAIGEPTVLSAERPRYFRAFDFLSGAEKDAALAETLAQITNPKLEEADRTTIAIETLARLKGKDINQDPLLKTVIAKALNGARGTQLFVDIVRLLQVKDQSPALLELASSQAPTDVCADAARLLFEFNQSEMIKTILNGTNVAAATKLTDSIGNAGNKQALPLLEALVQDSARPLELRKTAANALTREHGGATALLHLAKEGKLSADLKMTAAENLNHVRWTEIKTEAEQILPLPKGVGAKPLPPVADLLNLKGDPTRGRAVFTRNTSACIECHTVNGLGTNFGPNLSEIGTKLPREAILESILNPSAGISVGFETHRVQLKDGDDVEGLLVSETTDELVIKDKAIVHRLAKNTIAKREKLKTSIMPNDLQLTMSAQELMDLVDFLGSLKKAAAAK